MTAKRAAEWIAEERKLAADRLLSGRAGRRFAEQADRVMRKAKAIGMTLPSHKL
jgi:hypothetical protein